jgi:hypothetical protein
MKEMNKVLKMLKRKSSGSDNLDLELPNYEGHLL